MRWIVATAAVGLGLVSLSAAKGERCKWRPPHLDRVAKLKAPDGLTARIACADVAHLGTRAVGALSVSLADKTITPAQARAVVSAMLVETVPLSYLKSYPELLRLLDAEVKTVRALAAPLFATNRYDSGAVGRGGQPAKPNPKRQAVLNLRERGGAAVVIAHQLIRSKRPGRRLFGAELLVRLGAVGQRATLEALRSKDRGEVRFQSGCVIEMTTVGAVVGRWLQYSHPFARPTASLNPTTLEAERYLRWVVPVLAPNRRTALVNRLRQVGGTLRATSSPTTGSARPRSCAASLPPAGGAAATRAAAFATGTRAGRFREPERPPGRRIV